MGKLIKLEWEKYEIGKYIRNAAILIVLLVIFNYAMTFLGIANDPDTGVPDMYQRRTAYRHNVPDICGSHARHIYHRRI